MSAHLGGTDPLSSGDEGPAHAEEHADEHVVEQWTNEVADRVAPQPRRAPRERLSRRTWPAPFRALGCAPPALLIRVQAVGVRGALQRPPPASCHRRRRGPGAAQRDRRARRRSPTSCRTALWTTSPKARCPRCARRAAA